MAYIITVCDLHDLVLFTSYHCGECLITIMAFVRFLFGMRFLLISQRYEKIDWKIIKTMVANNIETTLWAEQLTHDQDVERNQIICFDIELHRAQARDKEKYFLYWMTIFSVNLAYTSRQQASFDLRKKSAPKLSRANYEPIKVITKQKY